MTRDNFLKIYGDCPFKMVLDGYKFVDPEVLSIELPIIATDPMSSLNNIYYVSDLQNEVEDIEKLKATSFYKLLNLYIELDTVLKVKEREIT